MTENKPRRQSGSCGSDVRKRDGERLSRLAAFGPLLEKGAAFGAWQGGAAKSPGMITQPWFDLSAEANAFIAMLHHDGWVLPGFDWMVWSADPEGITLTKDPAAVAQATLPQLEKLLTCLVRRERFSEGALAAAFEAGILLAAARLAAALVAAND